MQISNLPSSTLSATDVLVKENSSGVTNKFSASVLLNKVTAIQALKQTVTIPANANNVSINMFVPTGWTFLCVVNSSSIGWIGPTYVHNATATTTSVWSMSTANTSRDIEVTYLVYQ